MAFFKLLNNKGQEEAPFELLIAVIVMGFVIVMGINAIFTLNREQCQGDIQKQMESIKSSLEIVARGEGSQNVYYSMPSCFGEKESKLQIVERDDTDTCNHYCGGNSYNCILLSFASPTYNSLKCLKLSNAITFPERNTNNSPPTCDVLPSVADRQLGEPYFEPINWREGAIPQGRYTLMLEINVYSAQPTVCAYLRSDTRGV